MAVHWTVTGESSPFMMIDELTPLSRCDTLLPVADWQGWQVRNLGRLGWSNGSLPGNWE